MDHDDDYTHDDYSRGLVLGDILFLIAVIIMIFKI